MSRVLAERLNARAELSVDGVERKTRTSFAE